MGSFAIVSVLAGKGRCTNAQIHFFASATTHDGSSMKKAGARVLVAKTSKNTSDVTVDLHVARGRVIHFPLVWIHRLSLAASSLISYLPKQWRKPGKCFFFFLKKL